MDGAEGFEPPYTASKTVVLPLNDTPIDLVELAGLEPATSALRRRRCYQLSYSPMRQNDRPGFPTPAPTRRL